MTEPESRASALQNLGELSAELAHELHNILMTIALGARAARLDSRRHDEHLQRLEEHVALGQALVRDVLSLANAAALPRLPVRWSDVLWNARNSLRETPQAFIDALGDGPAPSLHLPLMSRLFHALYANAVEAGARTHTPVRITTRSCFCAARGVWEVQIEDDGPGIPPALREALMQPGVTGHEQGHGFGLALARRIATAHDATLELAPSTAGALFVLTLPLPTPPSSL